MFIYEDTILRENWCLTCRSPEKLRHWIKLLLDAYHTNKQSTMIKEAQKLMNPEVISRLEILLEYMDETFV